MTIDSVSTPQNAAITLVEGSMRVSRNGQVISFVYCLAFSLLTTATLSAQSNSRVHSDATRLQQTAVVSSPGIQGTVSAAGAASLTNLPNVLVKLYGPYTNGSTVSHLGTTTPVSTTTTNANGAYTITGIHATSASNHYLLLLSLTGYSNGELTVNVTTGTVTVNTALLPILTLTPVCAPTGSFSWQLHNPDHTSFNYTYAMLRGTTNGIGTIGANDVF